MTIVVIGSGSIGTRHFNNLGLLGVKAEHLSMRASGLSGVLARLKQGADGAVIATETQLRLPLIAACADRGIPMYIEKPLTHDGAVLAQIYNAAAPVATRSLVGFMMRYHPAFRYLARADLTDTYRYSFEIGHDVTKWRANWRFGDSYASRPEGGGVLLDLCHELDMAACLFPAATLKAVVCLGHTRFPGVDFATRINLGGAGLGSVAMDYLSPVSLRRIDLLGTGHRHTFDLATGVYTVGTEAGMQPVDFPLERNDMFLSAMRDFLALIAGKPTSSIEHFPRLDLVRANCELIAAAHEMRHFSGRLNGEKP